MGRFKLQKNALKNLEEYGSSREEAWNGVFPYFCDKNGNYTTKEKESEKTIFNRLLYGCRTKKEGVVQKDSYDLFMCLLMDGLILYKSLVPPEVFNLLMHTCEFAACNNKEVLRLFLNMKYQVEGLPRSLEEEEAFLKEVLERKMEEFGIEKVTKKRKNDHEAEPSSKSPKVSPEAEGM